MANTPHSSGREFNIGRVKGRPVIDSNGDNVGTIEDVVVEPGTWKVSGFVVNIRREIADALHMGRKGFMDSGPRIEISSDRIRSVGDNVILNIDRTMIADALGQSPVHNEPVSGEFRGEIDEYPPPGVPAFEPPRY